MSQRAIFHRIKGRPPRHVINSLRAKTWYWAVAWRTGAKSAYDIEKRFLNYKFEREYGITKRPCLFDKYRRGEHAPSTKMINKIGNKHPDTKELAEHPFWRVVKLPIDDINTLHKDLALLRKPIVDMLFEPTTHKQPPRRRYQPYFSTFSKLSSESDLDAMTACLGLIQEAKIFGQSDQYFCYTWPSFHVYRRLIIRPPFFRIAHDLFSYLRLNFWDNPDGETIEKQLGNDGLNSLLLFARERLLLIEDLGLLKTYVRTPYSCLYIAEKYLNPPTIQHIENLILTQNKGHIKRMSVVRNLHRALQRWEEKNPGNL